MAQAAFHEQQERALQYYLEVSVMLRYGPVAQRLVLSLSELKVVGSNPRVVVPTPIKNHRVSPSYLTNARQALTYTYHLIYFIISA